MDSKEKNKRLSVLHQMPELARIDHRYLKDESGKFPLLSNLSKKERRKINSHAKELARKYKDILKRIEESGAGFPVDRLLRELVVEYTHRYASSGAYTQPLNFNYFESFCHIRNFSKSFAPYAVLANEVNQLFTMTDYFDYFTSDKNDNFDLSSLMSLPEAEILHFTTNGDVLDFNLLNSDGREFVISGFSMIRRGKSLHWYLLGGEIFTESEWELKSTKPSKINDAKLNPYKKEFLSEYSVKNDEYFSVPIALEGTKTAMKTIVAGEIDLITHKYLGRCIMTENENCFDIVSDDPEVFIGLDDEKYRKLILNMKKNVEHASVLWDLVGSMFQLPSYFAYTVNLDKNLVDIVGQKIKSMKSKGGRGLKAQYKVLSSLNISDSASPVIRSIIPQYYQTETSGHWRKLKQGAIGKDASGNKEIGRTWIQKRSKWREQNQTLKTIYVKSTVKAAELKVIEYEQIAKIIAKQDKLDHEKSDSTVGELYVLRCSTMKEEYYKVGWTSGTSERRAKELSSATGVPTAFVVVKYWKHKDASALEKSVHMMLEPYRVSNNREFFHASFKTIEKIIEAEL